MATSSTQAATAQRYTHPKVWIEYAATLPQARRLDRDDIARWAEHLSTLPEDVAHFHAARVRGIGGSEIGVLLTEAQGGRDPWSTANWIVRQKLLQLLPLPPEPAMLRGKVLEPVAVAAFMRPRGIKLDRDALKAIMEPIASGKYAWMAGTPDLAVQQGGKRFLVEFKNPGNMPAPGELISLRYAAQGLFYAAKAARQGLKVDGTILSHYSIEGQDGLACWLDDPEISKLFVAKITGSLKRGAQPLIQFVNQEIPNDPEVVRNILEVGAHYWNDFVMRGQVPNLPAKPTAKVTTEQQQHLEDQAERYLLLKKIEGVAKEHAGTAIADIAEAVSLDPSYVPPHGLTVQRRTSFDLARATALLRAKGVPPSEYSEPLYDISGLVNAAEAAGVDTSAYCSPGSFDMARALRHLREDEVKDLTNPNPVPAIHARSSDKRVVAAIVGAERMAEQFTADVLQVLGERQQQRREDKAPSAADDDGERKRRR